MIFDWLQKGEEHEEMGKKGGKRRKKRRKNIFVFENRVFFKMDTVKKKKSRYSNRGKAHIINLTNSFLSIFGNANEI